MSDLPDCKQQSKSNKRHASPELGCSSPPYKEAKQQEDTEELALDSSDQNSNAAETRGPTDVEVKQADGEPEISPDTGERENESDTNIASGSLENADARPTTSSGDVHSGPGTSGDNGESEALDEAAVASASGGGCVVLKGPGPTSPRQPSDWAAIVAAEALASMTRGDGDDEGKERPCSAKEGEVKKNGKRSRKRDSPRAGDAGDSPKSGKGQKTRGAAADSSTSFPDGGALLDAADAERAEKLQDTDEDEDDDDEDSLLGSSSSPDFSSASDDDNADDTECAIVSVKMASETRQSVALLARLQLQLEALERKAARQHERLELKLNQQRRPHLEQRSTIIKAIPGFWVTALLNHPQLSAQIDENDEDALSYMTNLEIENNGMNYRIGFHFRRNPYFQNSVLVKELHLAPGGTPMSISNPILWHRGQNLTARGRLVRGPNAYESYPSFFCWFSDHSNPERDEIAAILKNDLFRNPLRYYLTPLWEPRQNGSTPRAADNSNGSDCVVISDSDDDDDDEEGDRQNVSQGEDEEDAGSGEEEGGEREEEEHSDREREEDEELDVEELDEPGQSGSQEDTHQEEEEEEEEEEDIEVDGEEEDS
ncbi:testis specific protein Y-linked [Megalops cyprinoides]|uniref:testis specific protein Y-linked n=1 Tax=Megalops cyprinoides TaxID=118141 RepID=UPI001863B558|nr:testis specific protein Y-linked [Megalops cyprinoides]